MRAALLMMGDQTAGSAPIWLDPSDLASMKQERTGASATTAVAVGNPVGSMRNKGTLGGWLTAPIGFDRPILRQASGVYYLEALTSTFQLDFTSGMSALFTGNDFVLTYGAYFQGSGSILGGAGSTTNQNLHTGVGSAGSINFNYFNNGLASTDGIGSGAVMVVSAAQGSSGRTLRKNGAQVASDGNTARLTNGSLCLFQGPISQSGEMRLTGLIARAPTSNARRNRDEQILAGKSGLSFTST